MKNIIKLLKQTFAVCMAVLILLSTNGVSNVLALTPTNTKTYGIYRISLGGTNVYCLNEGHHAYVNFNYTEEGYHTGYTMSLPAEQRNAITKVIEYGYNSTGTWNGKKYVATQLLIWDICNSAAFAKKITNHNYDGKTGARYNAWSNGDGKSVSAANKKDIRNHYLNIFQKASQDEVIPSYMSAKKSDATVHKMSYSASKNKYSFTTKNTDSNSMISKMSLDTSDSDTKEAIKKYGIATSVSGKKLTVTAKSNITEETTITLRFKKDVSSRVQSIEYLRSFWVYDHSKWESQGVTVQHLSTGKKGSDNVYGYFKVKVAPTSGTCKLKKVNEKNEPLANAGFTMYIQNKETKQYEKYGEEKFTNVSGEIEWNNIDLKGETSVKVKMVETTPPYHVDPVTGLNIQYKAAPDQVKSLKKDKEISFSFVNDDSFISYGLNIEKQDKDNADLKLSGTVFKLAALEDIKVYNKTVIKAGEYVKGNNDGDLSSWTWNANSSAQVSLVTDEEGLANVNGLPQGQYQLIEIASSTINNTEYSTKIEVSSASNGMVYSYEGNKFTFTNNQNNEVTLVNKSIPRSDKGSIRMQLYKCDSENNEVQITGAKFRICKADGTPDGTIITEGETDRNGYLRFPSYNIQYELDAANNPINFEQAETNLLEKDTLYYLQETDATDEYIIDKSKHYFKITCDWNNALKIYDIAVKTTDESGNISEKNEWITNSSSSIDATYTYTATNKHKKLAIKKVDQYGNAVLGATLQLFRLEKLEEEDADSKEASGEAESEEGETDLMDGYDFAVKNSGGLDMTEWVTDGKTKEIDVQTGTYLLRETVSPTGYYTIAERLIEIKDSDFVDSVITITAVDDQATTYINKYEKGSLEVDDSLNESYTYVNGAVLQLFKVTYENDGSMLGQDLIDEWTTRGESHILHGLPQGDYLLHEKSAPDGYAPAGDITFHLNYGEGDQTINMYDTPMTVTINKFMVDTTQWCPGCTLALYDSKGTEIDRWVTEEASHSIKALKQGTYTLKELSAPEGYQIAKSITFTVKYSDYDEYMEKTINMYNATVYTVTVNKYQYATTTALKGAKLALYKVVNGSDDILIDSWTTNGKAHITKNLEQGKYIVKELSAPEGYKVAESISFTIDGSSTNTTINMYDKQKVNLYIRKYEAGTREYVVGARLAIYDSKGKEVESWVTGNKSHIIKDMPNGTYVLRELQVPEGYERARDITFKISDKADKGKHTVTMYDRRTHVPEIPQTGDDMNLSMWYMMAGLLGLLGGIVVGTVVLYRKNRGGKEQNENKMQ